MTATTVYFRGQRVVVSLPDASEPGRLSLGILETLALAKSRAAAACLLRPSAGGAHALFELTARDVPQVAPRGAAGAWMRTRWQVEDAARRAGARAAAGAASFWHEGFRELRRHIGDERLPFDLRARLRAIADWMFARSKSSGADTGRRLRRRLLREPLATELPAPRAAEAWSEMAGLGLTPSQRVVALDVRGRVEPLLGAVDYLVAEGYTVVRIGDPSRGPVQRTGVIDLCFSPRQTALLELFVIMTCDFVVCGSRDVQQVAWLANRPCLLLNAWDPFSGYPIREDGLYMLQSAIDLDSGRVLTPADLLREDYYRNLRNCGHRENSAAEVLDAVREMHHGVRHGWTESNAQARFRRLVEQAGAELAPRFPLVARWAPDDGFIGDGRLARCQADRLS